MTKSFWRSVFINSLILIPKLLRKFLFHFFSHKTRRIWIWSQIINNEMNTETCDWGACSLLCVFRELNVCQVNDLIIFQSYIYIHTSKYIVCKIFSKKFTYNGYNISCLILWFFSSCLAFGRFTCFLSSALLPLSCPLFSSLFLILISLALDSLENHTIPKIKSTQLWNFHVFAISQFWRSIRWSIDGTLEHYPQLTSLHCH